MTAKELFESIKNDNLSGASELLRKAVEGLKSLEGDELMSFVNLLPLAQPSMAPLLTLWEKLSAKIESGGTRDELLRAAAEFLEMAEHSRKESVSLASVALAKYSKFATISFSSTVRDVFLRLGSQQKISVLIPESRPMCEGKMLAKELAQHGIEAILVSDMAAVWLLKTVECAVFGADAITPNWVVNKTGTYALTLAARHHKIPVFVIASKDKILSKQTEKMLSISEKDPSELADNLEGVKVKNFYFDLTPLQWVQLIVG